MNSCVLDSKLCFVVQFLGGPAGGGVPRRPPVGLHQGAHPGRPGLQHDLRRGGEPGDRAEVRESGVRAFKQRPQLPSVLRLTHLPAPPPAGCWVSWMTRRRPSTTSGSATAPSWSSACSCAISRGTSARFVFLV